MKTKTYFLYQSSSRKWGIYLVIMSLIFGVLLGILLLIDPFEHHFPPVFNSLYIWIRTIIGVGFIVGGAWNIYRGIKLLRSKDDWYIEINDEKIIYRVPGNSREDGFEIPLDKIASFTTELQDVDSEAENINYFVTSSGKRLYVGFGENMFNVDKFKHALSKLGIEFRELNR